jgi:hypothetical protein
MEYPGAREPGSPVNRMIQQGIANRFPGRELSDQVGAIGPWQDPYHSGFTTLLGNNRVGRGLNRAFGWARDFDPFLDDTMGSLNWFQNYNRAQVYRDHLKALGFQQVASP